MGRFTFPLLVAFLLVSPAVCLAQDSAPVSQAPQLQQRYDELVLWLDEYKAWEEWTRKWANKIAFNSAGGIIKKRPVRPEPPAWLAADCQAVLASEGALAEACDILATWDSVADLLLRQKRATAFTPREVEKRSSFLHRVHLTGGWVPAQLPAPEVYLVAGMQVGVIEVGRATLPAVGVGLVAVADGSGGHDWKPATIIGIGYRLTSFGFPWINREANLHINVARATIHGATTMPVGFDPSQNLIGFSLTFARR